MPQWRFKACKSRNRHNPSREASVMVTEGGNVGDRYGARGQCCGGTVPSNQRLSSFLFELIFVLFPLPFLLLPCELDPDFGEVAASSSGTGLHSERIKYFFAGQWIKVDAFYKSFQQKKQKIISVCSEKDIGTTLKNKRKKKAIWRLCFWISKKKYL